MVLRMSTSERTAYERLAEERPTTFSRVRLRRGRRWWRSAAGRRAAPARRSTRRGAARGRPGTGRVAHDLRQEAAQVHGADVASGPRRASRGRWRPWRPRPSAISSVRQVHRFFSFFELRAGWAGASGAGLATTVSTAGDAPGDGCRRAHAASSDSSARRTRVRAMSAVARLDDLDQRRVERHRGGGVVVEDGHQRRVLVRPAGERVEEQLEADAARGLADGAHEREVGAGEGDGIVDVLLQHLDACGDGVDVLGRVALGGEGHGLDRRGCAAARARCAPARARRDRRSFRPLTSVPSISSPARSRHDATTVPAPWRVVMSPRASRRASEARRVSRLTPRASDSSRSLGSRVPGRRRPERISLRSRSATASTTLCRATGANVASVCEVGREARGGGSGLRS